MRSKSTTFAGLAAIAVAGLVAGCSSGSPASAASGSGSITLKPVEGSSWPVRLAFRVRPGAIGVLDVRGAERTLLPITDTAGPPVDLELTPSMYTPTTPQMTVSWGPVAPAS